MSDELTLSVIKKLDSENIPYILVGSYSSNVYGKYREPVDADFEIKLDGISVKELTHQLTPEIWIDPGVRFEPVSGTQRCIASLHGIPFRVEFFISNDDLHNQERFYRRRLTDLHGHQVWVPTAEDVLITKLRWGALNGRIQDKIDARDIIVIQGDKLDWNYVHSWCEQHGTCPILDEVRAWTQMAT